MAKEGWLTIRKVPSVSSSSGNAYHQELKNFFEGHTLCPKCRGKGARKKEGDIVETTTVRYGGIEELEKLKAMEDVPMADVIRDILERQCRSKKSCVLCNGSRFVEVDVAKEYRRKMKGKKRGGKSKKGQKKIR